ncbi:MAG: hypothetical protein V3S40_09285, partial [Kiloniellales bacterium]
MNDQATERDDINSRMCERPAPPRSIEETGLGLNNLIGLVLKTMYVTGRDRSSLISDSLKLNNAIIGTLLEEVKERALVENLGLAGESPHSEFRYSLTSKGREWAAESLALSQYIGPAPVTLDDYQRQIERQRIRLEQIDRETLLKG